MPIDSSNYKSQKLVESEFFCPHCFGIRPYRLKPMSKDMSFYPVPALETMEPGHGVECLICCNVFNLEILRRNIQNLLKLVETAKDDLEKGVTPQYLKLRCRSDGFLESFVDQLLSLARH